MVKKILLFLFLFIFIFQGKAFAQTVPTIFNASHPVLRTVIVPNLEGTRTLELPPFTAIEVPANAFSGITSAVIYQSDFDSIKSILPSNQYPVSAYYMTFFDQSGKPVTPKASLGISSNRTYAGSSMYLDIIYKNKLINVNSAKYPDIVSGYVISGYNSFVISTDHPLTKNDPSLTSPSAQPLSSNLSNFQFQPELAGLILAVIALVIIGATLFILLFARVQRKS